MNVTWKPKGGLIEGISYGFEYALLDREGTALTPTIQCKDYFTDLWWSEHEKQPCSVYGFNWKPGKVDKDARSYLMAVRKNKQDMRTYRIPLEQFLNEWENLLEFRRSKVSVGDEGKCLVVVFSQQWTTKPVLISAFTLFLRVGCDYDGSNLPKYIDKYASGAFKSPMAGCDPQYVKTATPNLTKLMKSGVSAFAQSYGQYGAGQTYDMHNAGGIVNYKGK